MKIQPQKGGWDTETCHKLIPEDTPRDKWAKLILRMKGNIPEIKLRERERKHSEEKTVAMHTKAAERQKEKESQKCETKRGNEKELIITERGEQTENNHRTNHKNDQKEKQDKGGQSNRGEKPSMGKKEGNNLQKEIGAQEQEPAWKKHL